MDNKKANPRQQSMFQGEECVVGIRRSGGIIGFGIIPPIMVGPKQGLIDTDEFDLVIGGDGMGQGIVKSGLEWDLVPLPMVEQAKEPKTGHAESNEGQNPTQVCECPPKKSEELGAELRKTFFKRNELCVHTHTAQKTPTSGQDKECNWIKSKSGLTEDCCEPTCCGCVRLEQEQDKNLNCDLHRHFHA